MEGSFDWDTSSATVYTNDEIKVTAVTDLASAPAFTIADPTIVSATPNSTGTSWTIRGKAIGTTTITIDTTNIQSSVDTLTVTVQKTSFLNQRGLASLWKKIKERKITSNDIDYSTMKPYWKVVSVVKGTNEWHIPSGYRHYRIVMRFSTSAPTPSTTTNRPAIGCHGKTGTSYFTSIYSDSATLGVVNQQTWGTDNDTVALLTGVGNNYSATPIVEITLDRTSDTSDSFVGVFKCSGSGFDYVSIGKLEFSVTANSTVYLYGKRGSSTASSFSGYVEALDGLDAT